MKLPFAPTHLPAMPRPLRWLFAALLSLASIAMLLVLVLFITVTLGAFVLTSTSPGQKWLSAQLSTLTAGSGYDIQVGRLRALGASQLALSRITVTHHSAPFVQAENIVLTPTLASLLNGELRLDLRVRTLALHETPTTAQTVDAAPAPAPIIPDAAQLSTLIDGLALQRLVIANLHIGQLALVDLDGTATTVLSPTLYLLAEKSDEGLYSEARLSTTGLLEDNAEMISTLRARLAAHAEQPAVSIDELSVTTPTMSQSLSGQLALPRRADDPTPLALTLHAPLPQDNAIALSALIDQHSGLLSIKDLAASGPGVTANGGVTQKDTDTWAGSVDTVIDFSALAQFIPAVDAIPLKEELKATLSFDGPTLNVAIDRLRHELADLREVKVSTTPIADAPTGSRSVTISAKENLSKSALTATANILFDDSGTKWRAEALDATLTAGTAGKIVLNGALDLETLDLTLTSNTLRLDRLQGPLAAANAPLRLDNTKITASGTMAAPVLSAVTRMTPVQLPKGTPALTIDAKAAIAQGMASLDAKINSRALQSGNITARLPLTLSFIPFELTMPDSGLDAKATLRGNLSALSGFLPVGLTLSGDTNLDASASGNPMAPVSAGTLTISGGKFRDSGTGLALQNIALKARFDNDAIAIDSLTARDARKGRLTANGRLTLAPASWPIDATLKMVDIDPFTRSTAAISTLPVIDGVLDADVRLSGARNAYLLAGTVGSDKLDITLPATFSSSVPQLNVIEKRQKKSSALPGLDALRLDIAANMTRQIYVRGWGLDAEFGGKIAISGTAENPVANGSLQSLRGRYEEFGRKFTLARARLDFIGAIPPSPYLDIIAETKVDGITAQVVLGGSASKPKVTFTSTPALPQEDVLSHILFGKDRANISPTQAIQMAQTLRRFSGGGQGLDPLGKLRTGFGLDDLSVDSNEEGGTSVGAGKYLSDDVYLQVGGGDKGGEAKVQIELTPNIKVESEVGQDARAGGGLFWEWEY